MGTQKLILNRSYTSECNGSRWRPVDVCTRFTSDSKLEIVGCNNGTFTAQVTNGEFNFVGTGATVPSATEDAVLRFFKHEKIEPAYLQFLEEIKESDVKIPPKKISDIMSNKKMAVEEYYNICLSLKISAKRKKKYHK